MNVQEAVRWFVAHDVPTWMYTAGGLSGGECEGIELLDDRWTVYYSERGQRNNRESFDTEEAAVACWVGRVNSYLQQAEGRSLPSV